MDIRNHSLINQNSVNTESQSEEFLFEENNTGNKQSSFSLSAETLLTFTEENGENGIGEASEDIHLEQHHSRSRIHSCKSSDQIIVYNCNDHLPPLESEQQFRMAVTKCARGGDSMERNRSDGEKEVRDVPDLSPTVFKTRPVIISASPLMTINSCAKTKTGERRKTAAELDALFTRLSTPKCIKGKDSEAEEIEGHVQQMRGAQRRRFEATKGLCVKTVRTRSNSTIRSRSRHSSLEK